MEEAKIVFQFEDRSTGTVPAGGAPSQSGGGGTSAGGNSQKFHDGLGFGGGGAGGPMQPGGGTAPPGAGAPQQPTRSVPPSPVSRTPKMDKNTAMYLGMPWAAEDDTPEEKKEEENVAQLVRRFLKEAGGEQILSKAGADKALSALEKLGSMAAKIPGAPTLPIPSAGTVSTVMGVAGTAATFLVPAALSAVGVAEVTSFATSQLQAAEERAGAFSSELNQARVEETLARIRTRQRTAEILGDEVAEFVRARARAAEGFQGLSDTALEPFLQKFNEIIGPLSEIAAFLGSDGMRTIIGFASSFSSNAIYNTPYGPMLYAISTTWKKLGEALENFNDRERSKRTDLFSFFDNQPHLPTPAPFRETDETPTDYTAGGAPGLTL